MGVIGTQRLGYAEKRNIYKQVASYQYLAEIPAKRPSLLHRLWNKIIPKSPKKRERHILATYFRKEIDLYHFFNTSLIGVNNWGVTFETLVPFYQEPEVERFLAGESNGFNSDTYIKLLAKDNCKFLIQLEFNYLKGKWKINFQ